MNTRRKLNRAVVTPLCEVGEAVRDRDWRALAKIVNRRFGKWLTWEQLEALVADNGYSDATEEWGLYLDRRMRGDWRNVGFIQPGQVFQKAHCAPLQPLPTKPAVADAPKRTVKKRVKRPCRGCGASLVRCHPSKLTCGPKCRMIAYRKGTSSAFGRRNCLFCATSFWSKRKAQWCCNASCYGKLMRRRAAVLRLRAEGRTWPEIAARYGVKVFVLKRWAMGAVKQSSATLPKSRSHLKIVLGDKSGVYPAELHDG